MRNKILILTAAFLVIFSALGIHPGGFCSYADTVYEEKTYEDLITYDIWKHSSGEWQYGNSPGSSVSFDYSSSLTIDTSMKLLGVNVEFLSVPSNHFWYDMSLKNAVVSGVKYKDGEVTYKVKADLEANLKPLDIKQYDWQNENVEGYRYYIPVKVTVKYEKNIEMEDIEEDTAAENDEETGGTDVIGYTADADLIMPDKAYAGHRVLLQDNSTFTNGTEEYSAYQFYKQGLGSSSFRKVSGEGNAVFYKLPDTSAGYYTDRYAVFSDKGDHEIKLSAKVNGGYSSVDTEEITIMPVPDVNVTVGGIQKQNRKQILNISVALDPENGVNKIWAEISEKNGEEAVHLEYVPGISGQMDNSALIKTRPIKAKDSNEYYENVFLEFLTKNETEKEFKYTVYIEDEEGKSDIETGYFTVYPDEAPKAVIDVDEYSIREQNSNTAEIDLSDKTLTYSDNVERTWFFKENGEWIKDFLYEDNSFGTMKKIIHFQEGVGKAEYMLSVKDIIPEDETLSEYITDSEIKSDTAFAETDVINIAPVVSIDAAKKPDADILIITSDKDSASGKRLKENISTAMAEKGISCNIYYQEAEGGLSDAEGFGEVIETETPFSYNSQWTSYEDSNFIADSRKVYKIGAYFGEYGGGEYSDEPMPSEPYIVEAYDLKTGEIIWEKSFYDNVFSLGTEFEISQDDSEDFIYITNYSKTLIIDKEQGEILGVLNNVITGRSFVEEAAIYSFTDNGILKTNKSDGVCTVLDETPIYGVSERLHGKISFTMCKNGVLNRGYFDPIDESIELVPLEGTDDSYKGLDQDIYGNLAVAKMKDGHVASVKIWDERNVLIKEISAGNYEDDCFIIRDEDGRLGYASFVYNKRKTKSDGTKKYYTYVKVSGIFNDVSLSSSLSSSNDYRTASNIVYGYCKNDNVYIVTGSEYWYVFNYGTSGYSERSYCFEFNLSDNSYQQYRGSGDFSWLKGVYSEYGYLTDGSLVLQLTEGNPVNDGISGSTSMYTGYGRSGKYLLTKYYNKYLGRGSSSYEGIFIVDEEGKIFDDESELLSIAFYPKDKVDRIKVLGINNSEGIPGKINGFVDWLEEKAKGTESQRKVFSKGEKVPFEGTYSDYENDPSKASYYLYYHYPFNDGENSEVNYIADEDMNVLSVKSDKPLTVPIERFYQDGMYKVEHWQYDSTGNEAYDKNSNVATMYFFIEGSVSAPWIESIITDPASPEEGKELGLNILVDDKDKDELYLDTKVYVEGEAVAEVKSERITADSFGTYPVANIKISDKALPGKYTVVCKVSDGKASSIKEYVFSIVSDYAIRGKVYHTSKWEENRKKYNLHIFGNEFNSVSDMKTYAFQSKPRKRGINVFWSEEKFMLQADISGKPYKVTCTLKDTGYASVLSPSTVSDEGNVTYKGELWNGGIKGKWGSKTPAEAIFVFTAYYDGGVEKNFENSIIIDDTDSFWRVHKLY